MQNVLSKKVSRLVSIRCYCNGKTTSSVFSLSPLVGFNFGLPKLISTLTTKDLGKTSKLIVEQPTITHVVDSLLLFARENKLESLLVVSSYKLLIQNQTKKRLYKISFT